MNAGTITRSSVWGPAQSASWAGPVPRKPACAAPDQSVLRFAGTLPGPRLLSITEAQVPQEPGLYYSRTVWVYPQNAPNSEVKSFQYKHLLNS
jgi:hypothetical protein